MTKTQDDHQIITNEFIEKYKNKKVNWGFNGLGFIVYKRTYARLREDGNLEDWPETLQRCVNGAQKIGSQYTKEEAERLFDYMFALKCLYPGRMLWQLGTSTVDRFGGNSLLNCLAGETKVLTRQGWQEIKNLSGKECEIVTTNGKWVKAPFKTYGQQQLFKVSFEDKYGNKDVIFATANHRWLLLNKGRGNLERTTEFLVAGDKLPVVRGKNSSKELSVQGIQHGLVFGDGSCSDYESTIDLIGNTYLECHKYFALNRIVCKIGENHVRFGGMPNFYKQLPDINENKQYLSGFLAGWIAADGSVNKSNGSIRLFNANKGNLKFARNLAAVLGYRTSELYLERDENPFNGEESEMWSIRFYNSDSPNHLIIREDHKLKLNEGREIEYNNWVKIISVEKTERIEDVYCAEVPETYAFVVNSFVLTGNCWFTVISKIEDFCFLFENLMLGGGVGFSVRREDVHEFPKIKQNVEIKIQNTKDADFIVPDSRTGWISLLFKILESFFNTGKSFSYSTILVRGAGEPIKGFGGVASGPQILEQGITNICKVLKNRESKKLRSIDALDICNIIGSIVVAGNIRRSAEIALGDPDDILFLRAKRWDLGDIPNWRVFSNNTIYADSYDHVMEQVWDGYAGNGECYGFFNLNLSQNYGRLGEKQKDDVVGINPCQPTWGKILTKEGVKELRDIKVGDKIWSKDGWTTVLNKQSSGIKKVYEYRTTAGCFYGTENHKIISNGEKIEVKNADSIDIFTGEFQSKIILNPEDVMDGIVLGDGSVHKASNNLVHLCIGKDDYDYFNSEIKGLIIKHRPGLHDYAYEIETTITYNELPYTYLRRIPDRFYYGDLNKRCGFLRGLFSANGGICGDRVALKASSFKVIEQAQTMLSSLGIRSYYTTNKANKIQFSNGEYQCKQSYDLNVSVDRSKFNLIIGFLQKYKNEKLENILRKINKSDKPIKESYEIISTDLISEEEVFDITVDNKSHSYWTQGCNVSNCGELPLSDKECCNLSELCLNNITSKEELIDCSKLLYKTQKAVCSLSFLHESTNKIVHNNFRIGQGITGVCQSLDKLDWIDECYHELKKFDKEWSKNRNWPESIKLTTIKPSGSVSILSGSTPGIHPAYSRYYFRTIRMSNNDPLVGLCKESGYKIEYLQRLDETLDHSTCVVYFPCLADDKSIISSEMGAIKQLELLKELQAKWSDNAVSCTVYYRPEELKDIKDWLHKNYKNSIKSVSFLLHKAHGFKQAPYIEIDKAVYEENIKKLKPLKNINLRTLEELKDSVECSNGVCPIK